MRIGAEESEARVVMLHKKGGLFRMGEGPKSENISQHRHLTIEATTQL